MRKINILHRLTNLLGFIGWGFHIEREIFTLKGFRKCGQQVTVKNAHFKTAHKDLSLSLSLSLWATGLKTHPIAKTYCSTCIKLAEIRKFLTLDNVGFNFPQGLHL